MYIKRFYPRKDQSGFTLFEVLIALTILGISLGILIVLIGDSLKSSGKAKLKISALELAKEKIDAAVLCTLGEPAQKGSEQTIWKGKTEQGLVWTVEATQWKQNRADNTPEGEETGWLLYKVSAGGIDLSTIGQKLYDDAQE